MRANKMITDRVALKVEINVSTVQALCMVKQALCIDHYTIIYII